MSKPEKEKQPDPLSFFSGLRWIDRTPLVIEPYRQQIFETALYSFDDTGRRLFNLILSGRAKKNSKTLDMLLAGLYSLLAWRSNEGNDCLLFSNDEGQSADALSLAKKIIEVNPMLSNAVDVKQKVIERRDGKGSMSNSTCR